MVNESIELFRQHHPLPEEPRPAWGQILAVMQDVPTGLTEIERPFGRLYDEDAYPLDHVVSVLIRSNHSRNAVLWALTLLIEWRCLECKSIQWNFIEPPHDLPEDIRNHIRASGTHADNSPAPMTFTAVVPTEELPQWPSFARVYEQASPMTDEDRSLGDNWIPETGWGFSPGYYSYNGIPHELRGKQRELLKFFVGTRTATRFWSVSEIKREVWPGNEPEVSTLRSTISGLRKTLRKQLDLPANWNPIPVRDGAYRLLMPEE